ncbi:MAG: DUF3530 family protein [Enterobacterales bacterium]|nr:DUF3530 family protein [Enterobacterales bacterium]
MLDKKPILLLLVLLLNNIYTGHLLAAENSQTEDNSQSPIEANKKQLKLEFSADLKQLALNNRADDTQWLESENNQHLLLIHSAKGRKPRGNVLLLHAQGENPDHQRFIQPISRQLARLGWQVFIPSFAKQDFPPESAEPSLQKPASDIKDTTTNEQSLSSDEKAKTTSKTKQHYFKTSSDYQNYYQAVCQAVMQQTKIKQKTLFIIANQNAAYWGLSCLKMLSSSSAIIFIHPQLPKGVKNDLEQRFTGLKNPYFSFHPKNIHKDPFMRAFKKQVWRAKYLRFNIGMYSGNKLAVEDNQLVKTITGWLDSQNKNKK